MYLLPCYTSTAVQQFIYPAPRTRYPLSWTDTTRPLAARSPLSNGPSRISALGPLMTCVVRHKLRISKREESHSFASRTRHCMLRRRFFSSPFMFAACRSHFTKFAAIRVAVADFAGRFTEATNSKSCEPPLSPIPNAILIPSASLRAREAASLISAAAANVGPRCCANEV